MNLSIEELVKRCQTFVIRKYILHHVRTFGTYKTGDKISDDTPAAAFKVAREKAGIKAEEGSTPPTFHEIRSMSGRLCKKKYGQEFAQAIMGHKHAKMTAEYDDLSGGGWAIIEAKTN